jgi:branched-chain amino acid transport system substrate-binding protein
MKRILVTAVCTMVVVALTGCPAAEEQKGVSVKVGSLLSLSGEYDKYGQSVKNGIELAVDQINAAGGIKGEPLEITFEDSQSTIAGGTAALNKLISAGCGIVIGPETTDLSEALIPVAARNKTYLISPSASSPSLREIDSKSYFFRICATDDSEASQIAADMVREKKGWLFIKRSYKRALVLVRKDNAYTEGLWRAFGPELSSKQVDYEIIKYDHNAVQGALAEGESYNEQMTAILDLAAKFKKDGEGKLPEEERGAITIFAFADDVEKFLRAFKAKNLDVLVYTSSAVDSTDFFVNAVDVSEGIVFPRMFDPNNKESKLISSFVQAYKDKYQKTPDLYAAYGYDAALLIAATLNAKDLMTYYVEPLNFRMFMNDRKFVGVTGSVDFQQATGEVSKTPALYKMKKFGEAMLLNDYEDEIIREIRDRLNRETRRNN